MRKRKDRKQYVKSLETTFPTLRIYEPTIIENGQQGCFESHREIMKLNVEQESIVIFEDDALQLDINAKAIIEECKSTLKMSQDVDIIYLGCFPDVLKSFSTWHSSSLYNVKATQTHAYIVHQRFMKKFAHQKYANIPVDEYYRENARCLAWLPGIFVQANSPSNVSTKEFLSMLPLKNSFIRGAQLYAIHVGIPVSLVCVSLIILSVLIIIKNGRGKVR